MLFSLALIFIYGISLGGIMQKLKMPSLIGMLLAGIILGPYCLNLIAPQILNISAELRQIALIVILTRAGLALDLQQLRKIGRPALLMCFVPATCEIAAITILAPLFFSISYIEAAMLGAVLAAVSPAVVVPRMLKLLESGYGGKKGIPQLIMAGSSVDDIYVIVLFTLFLGMYQGTGFDVTGIVNVPFSIVLGLLLGILAGLFFVWLFKIIHMRDTVKILLLFSISFLFVTFEEFAKPYFAISGLLAVMALGATILKKQEPVATRLSVRYAKIWASAEILMFVLVGAAVNISYLSKAGIPAVALILSALVFRVIGVLICLFKTNLTRKERLFCAIAYLPKATVQAAIGGIPLAMGVASGSTILTVAVLSIIITAPLGAIGIDSAYKKILS